MRNPLARIIQRLQGKAPHAYISLNIGQTVLSKEFGELRLVEIVSVSQEKGTRVTFTFEIVDDSTITIADPGRRGIVSPL